MPLRPRSLLAAAGLVAAAVLGAGLALGGAAVFVGLGGNTTMALPSQLIAPQEQAAFVSGKALTVHQIFNRDAPGVVQVTSTSVVTTQTDPFFGLPFPQSQTERALGSGFVLDKAGHIVTNYHVIAGARSVEVSFSNSENMKARILGSDPSTDVAVLQIDARSRALKPLPLGDSDKVGVGDSVVAIGNPLGYERSVTAGIVSAVQRAILSPTPNQFPIDHVIQTDAAINRGNSGGPLINAEGQVIGVNSQIATGGSGSGNIGIGFAIPINTVRDVAAQLIKNGKVEHAFLGIGAKPITSDLAGLFHLPVTHGLLVTNIQPGSGAAAAGLRAGTTQVIVSGESYTVGGDLIVKADGVTLASLDQLRDLVSGKNPGDKLRLELYRNGKKISVDVKLGRQPSSPQG